MSGNGTIGVLALYLLFAWLISAAAGSWLTERKGYGERAGLMLGLLLSVAGLLIALALPARAGIEVAARRRAAPPPRLARSAVIRSLGVTLTG